MARDNSKDITHEDMRARLSDKSKQTASSLKESASPKSSPADSQLNNPKEILGAIYKLMVKTREETVKTRELEQKLQNDKKKQEDTQHQEILKALTVRRKPGRKKKPEEPKKPTEKAPEKPAEKPAETKGKDTGVNKAAQAAKDKTAQEAKKKAEQEAKEKVRTAEPVKQKPAETPKKVEPAPKTPESPTPTKPSAIKETIPNAQKLVMAGGLLAMASSVIAKEEGLPKKGKAYWDPPNQKKLVSIGYGHQIKDFEYAQGYISAGDEKVPLKGDRGIETVMSAEQSKKLLELDAPKYEKAAKTPLGDSWEKLSDQQKSALISYAYNVGSTNSLVKNGLKDAIDSGNMKLAAQIIREKGIRTASGVFNEALDKRRRKEADLFEAGIQINPVVNVTSSNTTGTKIDQSSQQNKDLKDQAAKDKAAINVINQSTNVQQGNQPTPQPKVDDRPPILRK